MNNYAVDVHKKAKNLVKIGKARENSRKTHKLWQTSQRAEKLINRKVFYHFSKNFREKLGNFGWQLELWSLRKISTHKKKSIKTSFAIEKPKFIVKSLHLINSHKFPFQLCVFYIFCEFCKFLFKGRATKIPRMFTKPTKSPINYLKQMAPKCILKFQPNSTKFSKITE